MTLSSASFLFFFVPLAMLIYFAVPGLKAKNIALIVISLLFYAGGELSALILLLISAAVCYIAGVLIKKDIAPKAVSAASIIIFLLILGTFKYLNFLISGINLIPGIALKPSGLFVPAGVSFFTFKEISYIADSRKNRENASTGLTEVLLYISFFPQIISGPITVFSDFAPQIRERQHSIDAAADGIKRIIIGLGKKLLIAGLVADIADKAFSMPSGSLDARLAWLGAIAYTMQIYFDFSGYSDMAIGLGTVFGFKTPENFRYPYISASITEFWRRWHISLSTWFRNYIYIPLGGNRKGNVRQALNKAAVFLVCGLWHGAGLNFILWGAWHGLLSILETTGIINTKALEKNTFTKVISHVYTLLAVVLGFVLFRADSLMTAGKVYAAMFSHFSTESLSTLALQRIGTTSYIALVLSFLLCTPLGIRLKAWADHKCPRLFPLWFIFCMAVLFLSILYMAGGGFTPFIYAQF